MAFQMGSLTHALDEVPKDPPPSPDLTKSIEFLLTVKREIGGESDKYEEFIAVLRDFKPGSNSRADVVDRIKVLLCGRAPGSHPWLQRVPAKREELEIQHQEAE